MCVHVPLPTCQMYSITHSSECVWTSAYAQMYTPLFFPTYTHTHGHTYTRTHARTHTYIHTHTHTCTHLTHLNKQLWHIMLCLQHENMVGYVWVWILFFLPSSDCCMCLSNVCAQSKDWKLICVPYFPTNSLHWSGYVMVSVWWIDQEIRSKNVIFML